MSTTTMTDHYLPPPDAAAERALRRAVEARIDELIGLLDHLDGDPDLEPSFGSLWDFSAGLPSGAWDEREPDADAEPDEDGEPTNGWPNNFGMGASTLGFGLNHDQTGDGEAVNEDGDLAEAAI